MSKNLAVVMMNAYEDDEGRKINSEVYLLQEIS